MSRAVLAMTGAAPVPVPPPMPAAMKHMCAPSSVLATASIVSSAAARPISGREPAPSPCVIFAPSWIFCAAPRLLERLRVGVGDQEVDPLDVVLHHVRDRVAARATHADHRDARGQLVHFRRKKFDHDTCLRSCSRKYREHPMPTTPCTITPSTIHYN